MSFGMRIFQGRCGVIMLLAKLFEGQWCMQKLCYMNEKVLIWNSQHGFTKAGSSDHTGFAGPLEVSHPTPPQSRSG